MGSHTSINTVLLLYISASCNWSLRKVNKGNIRGRILWLRSRFVRAGLFLHNQLKEFRGLISIKFSDRVYACGFISVLRLHRSHVAVAWVWIGYNIMKLKKREINTRYNPRYVNIVTYVHFTD